MRTPYTIIDGKDLVVLRENAQKCWLNGKSAVRMGDRVRFGLEDQLVGQLGELALARFLGHPEKYFERRDEINCHPWEGDGGSDYPGHQLDVKTSLMRRSREPLAYNLVVRPRERHAENLYVLALVPALDREAIRVVLVGFIRDGELPSEPQASGVFAGAYRVAARELHEMGELMEVLT